MPKKVDPLDGLNSDLTLTREELLQQELVQVKIELRRLQVKVAGEEVDSYRKKIDPKNELARLSQLHSDAAEALGAALNEVYKLREKIQKRLGIDSLDSFTINADGTLKRKSGPDAVSPYASMDPR